MCEKLNECPKISFKIEPEIYIEGFKNTFISNSDTKIYLCGMAMGWEQWEAIRNRHFLKWIVSQGDLQAVLSYNLACRKGLSVIANG